MRRVPILLVGIAALSSALVAQTPSFEVASIKVSAIGGGGRPQTSPDRFTRSNASLRDLIGDAYHLQRYEIVGGPDWLGSVRFDVNAKASFVPSPEQMRLMVQQLLAERFALRTHKETREMSIYVLRLARPDGRLGPQLTRTSVDCAAIEAERTRRGENAPLALRADDKPVCGSFLRAMPRPAGITLRYQTSGTTSGELASWLSPYVGRAVIDRTGLAGDFDLELAFNPGGSPSPASLDASVSIFTAIQEQLGLKLESTKGPVEVLVIDSVSQPTPD